MQSNFAYQSVAHRSVLKQTMEPSQIAQRIAQAASEKSKQHWRSLWTRFLASVAAGKPELCIPKDLADGIGAIGLEAINLRFW